jgi:PAS domain S-box-containing protein
VGEPGGTVTLERRQSEKAIRASEAGYRSLIENLEQCIFLKDSEFRFVTVNAPFCRALGRAAEEIDGHTDFDFYPPELARKFREDDRQVLQGRRLETEEESMIGGHRRIVRVIKTAVRDTQGRIVGILGIFWDITEQRTLEAQLRQAQKMEAIGQLAGGVAHDFNNLLTAIMGNLSLLGDQVGPDPVAQDMIRSAEAAALRAANLTGQLLGFARRALLRPEATNLNILIDEVVGLLRRTIDPRIIIEVRREPNLWPVLADSSHVSQVLMNLCLNSRDAMPAGGHLLIETANVVMKNAQGRHQLEDHPEEVVCLRVVDTGLGMTEEVRAHLFEPFFTTKGQGQGTGLGLATVFGIVKQHHGWIECSSQPRQGTVFSIYLPRFHMPRPQIAENDPMRPDSRNLKGTETILFVDDEPILRNLGRMILQQHDYRVLVAEDGIEALEVFQREQGKIDLVILDLTMPRLSGRDTFRELRLLDSEVRVLFASGFSHEQLSLEEQEQTAGFVAKPYRPRELATLVRETLDRAVPVR